MSLTFLAFEFFAEELTVCQLLQISVSGIHPRGFSAAALKRILPGMEDESGGDANNPFEEFRFAETGGGGRKRKGAKPRGAACSDGATGGSAKRGRRTTTTPASPSPEEVLARLNIKSHLAAADLPVAQRRCVFLFAHGAGGTRPRSESHISMRWVRILQRLGDVVTFDYPAMDIMSYTGIHSVAAAEALARFPGRRLFLAGHSMGCRGYPLHAENPANQDKATARIDALKQLPPDINVLFCSASNDRMSHSRWTSMQAVAQVMPASTRVLLVASGGHGIQLSKGDQEAADAGLLGAVDQEVLSGTSEFVLSLLA